MSAAVREALAAAGSTVEGVTVAPYFVQTTRHGRGWVRRDTTARDDTGFGHMVTWQVVVILPQDQAAAEKLLDRIAPALLTALEYEGVTTGAVPVQLALQSGTLPALIVTVIRAQENTP